MSFSTQSAEITHRRHRHSLAAQPELATFQTSSQQYSTEPRRFSVPSASKFENEFHEQRMRFQSKQPLKRQSSVPKQQSYSWLVLLPALLLLAACWVPSRHLKQQIQGGQNSIDVLLDEQHLALQRLESITDSIREYRKKISLLHDDNDKLFSELRQNRDIYTTLNLDTENYEEIEKNEDVFLERINDLERHIQAKSAQSVREQYGLGPYRVEFNCADLAGAQFRFVIELASVNDMPHTVHYFLQMVESGVWPGLTLMGSGQDETGNFRHVTTTPMELDLQHGHHSWAGQRFTDKNLTHLAFSEKGPFSPSEIKKKYTLAFSGHPGGPNFYIRSGEDTEDSQATFGFVVEGTEVFDDILGGRGKSGLRMLIIQSIVYLRSS